MDITPQHVWILASLGGGVGFLGVGIAMRSFLASRLVPPASPVTKPVVKEAATLASPAPSRNKAASRAETRSWKSSHWILQQEMLDLRSKMADQVAQVARETALRVHLEVALGKSHQGMRSTRAQIDAARQSHAELTLQKALLDTEIADLKLRLEKALQAGPPR
jgi:hypothetical protein